MSFLQIHCGGLRGPDELSVFTVEHSRQHGYFCALVLDLLPGDTVQNKNLTVLKRQADMMPSTTRMIKLVLRLKLVNQI